MEPLEQNQSNCSEKNGNLSFIFSESMTHLLAQYQGGVGDTSSFQE